MSKRASRTGSRRESGHNTADSDSEIEATGAGAKAGGRAPDEPAAAGSGNTRGPSAKSGAAVAAKTGDGGRSQAPRPVLSSTMATALGVAAVCIILAGVKEISSLLGPVILAVILVITVFPVNTWLRSKGVPGWLASGFTVLSLVLVLTVISGALALALAQLINTLPSYAGTWENLYQQGIQLLARAGVTPDQIQTALRSIDPQSLFSYGQRFLSSLSGFGSFITVLLVSMLFMALDAADMPRRFEKMRSTKPNLVESLRAFAFRVRRYWVVSTVFGLIVAVIDGIALYWLSVPMAVTFAILAFVTNYIPNVGFVIGLVPAALMALLDEGPGTALWVVVWYCVINFVVQTLIQPRYTGDAVGLSPTLTFLSLLFWAWVLGPLGALLAVPMTLFLKAIFVDGDPQARWFNAFISDTGE
ncbi:MAG: AI-2E family transporter [Actinomycetales bacterium]